MVSLPVATVALLAVVPAGALQVATRSAHLASRRISCIAAQMDETAFSALVEYGATQGWRDEQDDDSANDSLDHAKVPASVAQSAGCASNVPPAIWLMSELDSRFTAPSMQMQAAAAPIHGPVESSSDPVSEPRGIEQ